MPKRPCAVTITPDSRTIILGDKFGDVYAIPLLPTPEEDEAAAKALQNATKPFVPTATTLTVHSGANRRALEAQLKQAKENPPVKKKEALAFAHDLLLGHVSMLTDVVVAELGPEFGYKKPRRYILTSDRDEHIRISRGPPQSYVIEGFCLGHHEFVSKLCLAKSDLLVSGGGDDQMLVWDWRNNTIKCRIEVKRAIQEFWQTQENTLQGQNSQDELCVAVSGIWLFRAPKNDDVSKP
jgi:tRNA (guanine-N(7)-)-methyltransferase subunit TRM82